MRDPNQTAKQFQESLNELYDDPWFDSYMDPIIATEGEE